MRTVIDNPKAEGYARRRIKKISLRALKVLEIGAGGQALGNKAGELTRRLGSCANLRRILLKYANMCPIRGRGDRFYAIAAIASDCESNPANDLVLDAHSLSLQCQSVHLIVAIGPRGYGFATENTARQFLIEMKRALKQNGELIVVGRFVNPWFNPGLGSIRGRRCARKIAKEVGLRVADFLTPLGRHPIASIFRIPGRQFIQRSSKGKKLGPPSYFHRFIKK